MYIFDGNFKDTDRYSEFVKDWSCQLTILSKKDFYAQFRLFGSEALLLSRESISGKIACVGLSPIGYKTLIIPLRQNEFTWFNKTVIGNHIRVFPKDYLLDMATYSEMDFYYMSIEESVLFKIIDDMNYENCRNFFNGELNAVFLTKEFSMQFFHLANSILNEPEMKLEIRETQVNEIIYTVLKYLEQSQKTNYPISYKSRDLALKNAVEMINEEKDIVLTVPQICRKVGVSERTLYNCFKEKYHVSPGDYIKSFRLNQVKHELFKLESLRISEIAGKYNFWHMGQFAKDFKNQFGYLPSELQAKYKSTSESVY